VFAVLRQLHVAGRDTGASFVELCVGKQLQVVPNEQLLRRICNVRKHRRRMVFNAERTVFAKPIADGRFHAYAILCER